MLPVTPVSKRLLVTPNSSRIFRRAGNFIRRMSSSTNAAGLRPEETKALSERQPRDNEAGILKAIKEVSRLDEDNTTKSRADILVGIVVFMQTYNRA